MHLRVVKRQDNSSGSDEYDDGWWFSGSGMTIRYAVTGGIVALIIILFLGAYIHAHRRLKKGLEPLRYHKVFMRKPP